MFLGIWIFLQDLPMNQKRLFTRFFHSTGKLTFPVLPGSWVLYLAPFSHVLIWSISRFLQHRIIMWWVAWGKQERSQIKAGWPLGMREWIPIITMYGFIPSFPHEGPPRRQKKKASQVDHGRALVPHFSHTLHFFSAQNLRSCNSIMDL